MSVSVKSFFLLFLLVLVQPSTSISFGPDARVTVIVENELQGGQDLLMHCVSADNDLGVKLIHPNTSYHWKFHINVFGKTLYHCSFQWAFVLHKFVIYETSRDHSLCHICSWVVKEDGPCLVFDEKSDCYTWNSLEERYIPFLF
ncbi:hypothetical protein PHAVU_011G114700 [Phaseolus vulgaris]|uniref:S-protein homolog n=1 Tax=Phaseolus vulgaris TaxID=3885 RepID=V7AGK2_PHAVU|nr:hypothetical protein PHAVU_011G114700g [Phaseolus vulgaris]ESW04664.1 hypothetical protein PHAVU_011G114700g [Phaseolus vulgaris]